MNHGNTHNATNTAAKQDDRGDEVHACALCRQKHNTTHVVNAMKSIALNVLATFSEKMVREAE